MPMTSRDRLMAAMRRTQPYQLPIQVRGVRAWDREWVATRHPSYRPVIDAVAEYGDYVLNWGPPGGWFLTQAQVPATTHQVGHPDWVESITLWHTPRGDLRTRHLASKRGLPGMQMEFPIKSLEDVERFLSVPYEPLREIDPTSFRAQDELAGDRGIVQVYIAQDPIGYVHDLMGSELLAIWSIEERDSILRLIDEFLRRILDRVDLLISAGVGEVFATLGQEYATPPLHSARDFRRFCVEPERQILERIHAAGKLLHVHCHGPLDAVLDDFPQIADVLHPLEAPPMGDVTLADGKRRIGDRVCLEGNIQIGDSYATPTGRFEYMVKRAIEDGIPGGGYILAPTASPHTEVLTDLTVRNYVAMVETAAAYR